MNNDAAEVKTNIVKASVGPNRSARGVPLQ
jgi:hypothetical protein